MSPELLWIIATMAQLGICLALLRRQQCTSLGDIAVLQIASVILLFMHNLQMNFGDSVRYHYSWVAYDSANVLWQIGIVACLARRNIGRMGRLVGTAYIFCLYVTWVEYTAADDVTREIANEIFRFRQPMVAITDCLLAIAIYTGSIGNPDKEIHYGRTPD